LSIKQTAGTYVKAEKGIKIQGEAELMAVRLRLKRVKLVIAHVSLFRAKVSHGRLINNDVFFFLVHSYGRSDNSYSSHGNQQRSAQSLNSVLFLLIAPFFLLSSCRCTLAFDPARATTSVGRCKGKIDVFLGIEADDKRWDVNYLFPYAVYVHIKMIRTDQEVPNLWRTGYGVV
jgi:hypothetical protein